ncbi:hypothetical protein pdam_00009973, partial [Pocillopora damicornis]
MDGDPRTCFMSHAEKNPWLIVFIGDFQRASLIRIHSAESKDNITNLKGVGVSADNRSQYVKCALEKFLIDDRETSYRCSSQLYVFVSSVIITTTEAPMLRLCEVEVYVYPH